ncbi:MAG: peptidoglycan DD-metalloendopeptidase family protein [Alphaproteobacteria bacterium]|nr:peptidoglycan DD-metalloendopeptidase family protein [Alphaproteobacteria bacterium]
MFNRIVFIAMSSVLMNTTVYGDSKPSAKLRSCSGFLTEEVNKHRLTQSALSATPEVIKGDRHRFILGRWGVSKPNIKAREQVTNIKVVTTEQLVEPLLPEEKKKHNLYADTTERKPKLTFNWTMMPPVKGVVSRKFGEGEKKLSQGVVYNIKASQIVHAPVGGMVIFSGLMKEFEHVVMIEKDFENIILVAGISNADVKQGDKVYRGQKIGAVVKGGWVYVEFRNAGIPIDPQQILVSGSVNEE